MNTLPNERPKAKRKRKQNYALVESEKKKSHKQYDTEIYRSLLEHY